MSEITMLRLLKVTPHSSSLSNQWFCHIFFPGMQVPLSETTSPTPFHPFHIYWLIFISLNIFPSYRSLSFCFIASFFFHCYVICPTPLCFTLSWINTCIHIYVNMTGFYSARWRHNYGHTHAHLTSPVSFLYMNRHAVGTIHIHFCNLIWLQQVICENCLSVNYRCYIIAAMDFFWFLHPYVLNCHLNLYFFSINYFDLFLTY